ncbi:MAG: dipeptidase [Candidatus Fimenecus sp.]
MRFFDFHCDTIGECYLQKKHLASNDLHIDLQKGSFFDTYGQVFAIWIPDEKRGTAAFSYYQAVRDYFYRECAENVKKILPCKTAADIETAFYAQKVAAVLSVEGGAVLGGDLEKLDKLYQDGVRLMTLTWNDTNEIANGCFSKNQGGLTKFGKCVVQKMQSLHMLVDVSHLNERGFYDVAEFSEKPFLASHSDAQIVDNPYAKARNLTDDQIKVLIACNGLIGVNLCTKFLGNGDDTGADAILRHISHFLDLGAERILAFGCDFDGCTVHPTLNGLDKIPYLADYLLQHGISENTLQNIFFANGYRFLVANL